MIFQVNGKDLSKASHEEAVEAFKNATEPIIVQVLRRTEDTSQVSKDKMVCNAGTQTELQSGDLLWKVLQTYQVEKSDSLEGYVYICTYVERITFLWKKLRHHDVKRDFAIMTLMGTAMCAALLVWKVW